MSKILFATMPITGHVYPGLPIARQLVDRGHEIVWYTGKKFRQAIENVGAKHVAAGPPVDFDDADLASSFPERSRLKGIDQLKFDLKRIFTDHIPHSAREMQQILQTFPATVLVVDTAFGTGPLLGHICNLPCVTYGISALPLSSDEVAPFGLGLVPDSSRAGIMRNRALAKIATHVIFRDVIAHRNKVRAMFDLEPDGSALFEDVLKGSTLFLQGTVPEFEYPRSNMPDNVRFVGPLLPESPQNLELPDWWAEMVASKIPVVHVSQGTIATSIDSLILPTIYGLADLGVLVVVASKCIPPATQKRLPVNVRIADFLPYTELMQHVDVFVTNGGYGGIHYALEQAVPIVVAGASEDKPEVANRVAWSGVGINLKTSTPSSLDIRLAVKKVLRQDKYHRAAQRLAESIAKYHGPVQAANLIESIADR